MKIRYIMGIACIIISMAQMGGMILAFNNELPEWIFYSVLASGIGIYPLAFLQLRYFYGECRRLEERTEELSKKYEDQKKNARIHGRKLSREF